MMFDLKSPLLLRGMGLSMYRGVSRVNKGRVEEMDSGKGRNVYGTRAGESKEK
jgi:hypothetical protein